MRGRLNGGTVAEAVHVVDRSVASAFFHGHYDPGASVQLHVPASLGLAERILTVYSDSACLPDASSQLTFKLIQALEYEEEQ
jgi:hypothetical protein